MNKHTCSCDRQNNCRAENDGLTD